MWLFVEKVFFNEMCVKKKENRIFIFKGVIFLIISFIYLCVCGVWLYWDKYLFI